MIISDTSRMIGVFTIALLGSEFGQVWAKQGLQKSHTTLGEIARLHNCGGTRTFFQSLEPLEQLCSCRQRIN